MEAGPAVKADAWHDKSVNVASSRKREAAAFEVGSRCPAEPAKRRKRQVACAAGAEVHGNFVGTEVKPVVPPNVDSYQEVDPCPSLQGSIPAERPIFLLDLFCGTAGVAAAFKACGGASLGIDHIVDKRRVKGPVSKVDLSRSDGQQTVLEWISSGKVDAVMLAPPCGTASRAREIPIPKGLKLRKGMQPAPLRSEACPMGLENLAGVAKLKVATANRLYSFTRKVINLCLDMGIPFICENPRRSLMWLTDPFLDLPEQCRFQNIHSCMYGSKRKKSTAFLLNFEAPNLQMECDGGHSHLPWGLVHEEKTSEVKFSTSLETEYPAQLCKQLATAFMGRLQQLGKCVNNHNLQLDQAQRVGSGLQPRGMRAPLLLGDYKFKIDVTSNSLDVPQHITEQVQHPFQGIPLGAKLISSQNFSEEGMDSEKKIAVRSTFGVFRTPIEFLHRAMELQHPLDNPSTVDKSNLKAILFLRDHTAAEVMQYRVNQLKKYTDLAKDLSTQEQKLKNSLDVDVRRVLDGKRLLLFKVMAEHANVGDESLFQEFVEGFRLTGEMPQSHQFPAQLKPAMISVQQLKESAVWAKKMITSSCRRVGSDPEVARAV